MLSLLIANVFIKVLAIVILLDMFFGTLRAIKQKKFNSSAGIDGALRKIGMIVGAVGLWFLDLVVHIDLAFMIPDSWREAMTNTIGTGKIGMCEIFTIGFILFEAVSVLKNMAICNVPIFKGLRKSITKLLEEYTDEMPIE